MPRSYKLRRKYSDIIISTSTSHPVIFKAYAEIFNGNTLDKKLFQRVLSYHCYLTEDKYLDHRLFLLKNVRTLSF